MHFCIYLYFIQLFGCQTNKMRVYIYIYIYIYILFALILKHNNFTTKRSNKLLRYHIYNPQTLVSLVTLINTISFIFEIFVTTVYAWKTLLFVHWYNGQERTRQGSFGLTFGCTYISAPLYSTRFSVCLKQLHIRLYSVQESPSVQHSHHCLHFEPPGLL